MAEPDVEAGHEVMRLQLLACEPVPTLAGPQVRSDRLRLSVRVAVGCVIVLLGCQTPDRRALDTDCTRRIASAGSARPPAPAPAWLDTIPADGGLIRFRNGFAAYDRRGGRVQLLDPDGQLSAAVGRLGEGPMELGASAASERLWYGEARWLDAKGDSLALFDGRRISLLVGSRIVKQTPVPRGLVAGFSRVHLLRWLDDSAVVLAISPDPILHAADQERWRVDIVRVPLSGGSSVVRSFRSLPWPTTAAGIPVHGLGEASPSLAMQGACVVFHDGHGDTVRFVDVRTGDSAARRIMMPARFMTPATANEYQRLGVPSTAAVPIRFGARVARLALDERGGVWFWPARPRSDDEIWRLDPATGVFVIDTLNPLMARRLRIHP